MKSPGRVVARRRGEIRLVSWLGVGTPMSLIRADPQPESNEKPRPGARLTGHYLRCLHGRSQEHGQKHKICIHEGRILDGPNRYRACQKLGIDVAKENLPIGRRAGKSVRYRTVPPSHFST